MKALSHHEGFAGFYETIEDEKYNYSIRVYRPGYEYKELTMFRVKCKEHEIQNKFIYFVNRVKDKPSFEKDSSCVSLNTDSFTNFATLAVS